MKKPKYVLDSYALLAFFQAESGGEKVHGILKEAFDGRAAVFLSSEGLEANYEERAFRRRSSFLSRASTVFLASPWAVRPS